MTTERPRSEPGLTLAYGSLSLAMMMIGSNVVVGKILSQSLPVQGVLLLRTLLASVFLAPFVARRSWRLPARRVAGNLVLQALLGTVAYNSFLLAGLRHTGALDAGLILACLPAIVAIGAFLVLGERLSGRRWAAALLAALGMAALAMARGGSVNASLSGDGLVFAAVLGETSWILLARANAATMPPAVAAFWMQLFSAVLLLPLGAASLAASGAGLHQPVILVLLVYHALTASVGANWLWLAGLRRVPAGEAGVFTVLLPGTASMLAVTVLGERLTPVLLGGFVLMLGSILLASWPQRATAQQEGASSSA